MVFINSEGKFNSNSYLIDAEFMKLKKTEALYVIESQNQRMLLDTGEKLMARKIIKKLKDFELYPIHKILLTHAHWDHIQGIHKILKYIKEIDVKVLASENALDVLQNPEEMNDFFGYSVDPIKNVLPLKEGDLIELGDLDLIVHNFFGHTMDSIAIEDVKNKNIFVGDAIIDRIDKDTFIPVLFGPHFNEKALLATYKKLRHMKERLDSICLAHFGCWKGEDFERILNEMEVLYFKAKESIIKWYKENQSPEYVTIEYHKNLIPNSQVFTEKTIKGLQWNIEQNLDTLKAAGYIN